MTNEDQETGKRTEYLKKEVQSFEGAFDQDIRELIEIDGSFDEAVEIRATNLGYIKKELLLQKENDVHKDMQILHEIKQTIHHLAGHDEIGPIGYEFCGKKICLSL